MLSQKTFIHFFSAWRAKGRSFLIGENGVFFAREEIDNINKLYGFRVFIS